MLLRARLKKVDSDTFVDYDDPQMKKKFNQQREVEQFECPVCLFYMQNCLMNDEGFHSFGELFYCSNCDDFFTTQSYVVKSMVKVDFHE